MPEQMPSAVEALEAAIKLDEVEKEKEKEKNDDGLAEGVRLRYRAKPFIDMLRWNIKAGQEVVWGV